MPTEPAGAPPCWPAGVPPERIREHDCRTCMEIHARWHLQDYGVGPVAPGEGQATLSGVVAGD